MLPLGSISCPEGVFHADYREVFHFLTPAKGRDFTLPQGGISFLRRRAVVHFKKEVPVS